MPPKSSTPDAFSLRDGFAVQARVIQSLIIRDMMLRYGRGNIGFLWVVLEPMILTVGVMLVWSLAKAPIQHGIPIVALVLSGYMPLTMWRHTSNSGVFLIRRSISTLYHRHITLLDVAWSRMLTELAGVTLAFMVVYGTLFAFSLIEPISDPGPLVLGWLLMAALGSAFGILTAAITEYWEASERFVQPFQYLLIPLSGTFFMIEWLPSSLQEIIWYNPLIHCYELFRAGLFGEGVITHYDVWYPMVWAIGLTFVGLYVLDLARERVSGA